MNNTYNASIIIKLLLVPSLIWCELSFGDSAANTIQTSEIAPKNVARQTIDSNLRQHLRETIGSIKSFDDRFEAEVWLTDMDRRLKRFIRDEEKRVKLLKHVHQEANRVGLPPEIVLSVIHIESAFKPFAISHAGALGYMQIMPFWKEEIGRPQDNMMDLHTNIRYGCTILAYYLDMEKGNWIRALARYNGSLGRTVYPEKVLSVWQDYWFVDQT